MRYRQVLFAVPLALGVASTGFAGVKEFWHQSKIDYRRLTDWPYPFRCADQMAVRQPLAMMVDNGWRRENTLGDELFAPDSNELTLAGQYKVKWTVTQAPVHRRTVWVLRAGSEEATAARIDSVQQTIAKIVVNGPLPEVLVIDTPPAGISGDYLNAIDRSMRSTVAPPRLPAMQAPSDQ
jgi:hypothetical protein